MTSKLGKAEEKKQTRKCCMHQMLCKAKALTVVTRTAAKGST